MTRFDDRFAVVAPNLLAEFGEPIVYIPLAGPQRTITAIVNRGGLVGVEEVNTLLSVHLVIEVLTDPTNATYGGIDPATLDEGQDLIEVAAEVGQTPTRIPIVNRSSDATDTGMLRLICGT